MAKHDPRRDSAAEDAEDETRRRFREALDRKNAKRSGGSSHQDTGGKRSPAHGPIQQRQEFRRKSG